MPLTFAGSVCIEKQKNSLDLLSITKKLWTHISTSQRWLHQTMTCFAMDKYSFNQRIAYELKILLFT